MDGPHVHEIAGLPVGESERAAILTPPDKLGRVGEPAVYVVDFALQFSFGLLMFPPLLPDRFV